MNFLLRRISSTLKDRIVHESHVPITSPDTCQPVTTLAPFTLPTTVPPHIILQPIPDLSFHSSIVECVSLEDEVTTTSAEGLQAQFHAGVFSGGLYHGPPGGVWLPLPVTHLGVA